MSMRAMTPNMSPASAAASDAMAELADTLCNLSLQLPSGPLRQHVQAVRVIARQIDDALTSALGAPQGQGAQALALMQELTGAVVTDSQMHHARQLEEAYPALRLAIGKICVFYHQSGATDARAAANGACHDTCTATGLPLIPPASGGPACTAVPAPPAPPIGFAGFGERVRVTSPDDLRPPAAPAVPAAAPLAEPVAQVHQLPQTPPALPRRLAQCLHQLAVLVAEQPDAEAVHLTCPTTGVLWASPVLDLRDGRTYERADMPGHIPRQSVVDNRAVQAFVRAWKGNHEQDACELAARLDGACPRDAHGKLILDPICIGRGQIYSAAALVADYHAGRVPDALGERWFDAEMCVDVTLVRLMTYYDIGAEDEAPLVGYDATGWNSMPRFKHLAPMRHTDVAEPDWDTFMELWADRQRIDNLRRHKPKLVAAQLTYEHTMVDCNSDDYDRAFHGGLRLNTLIADITQLMRDVTCESSQGQLRVMRADCYRLKGDISKAMVDLRIVLATPFFGDDAYLHEVANAGLAFAMVLNGETDSDVVMPLCGDGYTEMGAPIAEAFAVAHMVGSWRSKDWDTIGQLRAIDTDSKLKELRKYLQERGRSLG